VARAGVSLRCRLAVIAGLAAVMVVDAPATASAQNILESFFGGLRRAFTPRAPNADALRSAESSGGGASSGYCVRLCDGRYFPVSGRGQMSATEMCRAFCPHAPTQLFAGGNIATAIAPTGQRYSNLPNAFLYRDKFVADCSCTGKGPLGLVPFEETYDPTLRTGDIVATHDGLMSYRSDGRNAEFVPATSTPGLSAKLREQLTQTRVAPGTEKAPEQTKDPATDGRATESQTPASPAPANRNVSQRARPAR
jgi:hypothetical protein